MEKDEKEKREEEETKRKRDGKKVRGKQQGGQTLESHTFMTVFYVAHSQVSE